MGSPTRVSAPNSPPWRTGQDIQWLWGVPSDPGCRLCCLKYKTSFPSLSVKHWGSGFHVISVWIRNNLIQCAYSSLVSKDKCLVRQVPGPILYSTKWEPEVESECADAWGSQRQLFTAPPQPFSKFDKPWPCCKGSHMKKRRSPVMNILYHIRKSGLGWLVSCRWLNICGVLNNFSSYAQNKKNC